MRQLCVYIVTHCVLTTRDESSLQLNTSWFFVNFQRILLNPYVKYSLTMQSKYDIPTYVVAHMTSFLCRASDVIVLVVLWRVTYRRTMWRFVCARSGPASLKTKQYHLQCARSHYVVHYVHYLTRSLSRTRHYRICITSLSLIPFNSQWIAPTRACAGLYECLLFLYTCTVRDRKSVV